MNTSAGNSVPETVYVDTHAHLSDDSFEKDRSDVANEALKELGFVIDVGTNRDTWSISKKLSSSFERIYTTVGWHPHDAKDVHVPSLMEQYKEWATQKTVAVGEIGLDYHYDFSPGEKQKDVFGAQLEMAADLHLPVVIHIREAFSDAFDILSSVELPKSGVVHCFSGTWEQAKRLLDMGLYLSFTGVIAFPRSHDLREVVGKTPVDRMFFETDCPYLAPPPKRGKRNLPVYVKYVVEAAAKELGMSADELAAVSTATACRFFSIELE